ncbi:hypothetical protein BST61_g6532 [Cercospora zeina]
MASLLCTLLLASSGASALALPDAHFDEPLIAKRSIPLTHAKAPADLLSRRSNAVKRSGNEATVLNSQEYIYAIEAQVAGDDVLLMLDTGADSTWVTGKGFKCTDPAGNERPQNGSAGGCPYYATDRTTFSGGLAGEPDFNVPIGGMWVHGPVGYDAWNLAGVTVQKQKFVIADSLNNTQTQDAKPIAGILGLSPGGPYTFQGKLNNFSSFVRTAHQEGALPAEVFGLALDLFTDYRVSDMKPGGVLALGGAPPEIPTTGSWAVAPVGVDQVGNTGKAFWDIQVDGYTVKTRDNPQGTYFPWTYQVQGFPYIPLVDTGTSSNLFIDDVYNNLIKTWDPAPSTASDGSSVVPCNATFYGISFRFGGVDIEIARETEVQLSAPYPPGDNLCYMFTFSAGTRGGIFGAPFLRNTVSVFDSTPGKENVQFKKRVR